MQVSQIPSKVPLPFANSGTKNPIPTASQIGITPGAASLTDGFPPLTFTPIASGGVPPGGADFNGIFNLITAVQQWQSAGGIFKYDAAFSTSIGGYPKGAILMSSTNASTWLNMVDNNTTDPDAAGANWVSLSAGRLIRTTIYTNTGGTLQASVDGGAFANAGSTFTPLALTAAVEAEVQAAGGAGGGTPVTTSGQVSCGSGGGAGAYGRKRFTSGFSGATITVGAAGTGSAGAAGGNGGSASFGALLSCTGGNGGAVGASGITPAFLYNAGGGSGGTAATAPNGSIVAPGGNGSYGLYNSTPLGGAGGQSAFGPGGSNVVGTSTGGPGLSPGSGGGGAASSVSAALAGGIGTYGLIIIKEYA